MTTPTTSPYLINDVVSDTSLNDSRDRDDRERLLRPRNGPRNNFLSYSHDSVNVRFRVRIIVNFKFFVLYTEYLNLT